MWRWLLGIALLPLTLHATSGFLQIGYGAKAKALGGAGIAFPQDAFVSAINPAGLSVLCQRADIGVHWLKHNGRLQVNFFNDDGLTQERGATRREVWWPEAGVVFHPRPCHTLGLAFYVAGEWKVNFGRAFTSYGTADLRSRYTQYFLTPTWAYALNQCCHLGVALNIAFSRFYARGLESIDLPNQPQNSRAGIGVRVGWFAHPTRRLQLGLTYQTRTWMGSYPDYSQIITQPFDLPPQFGFGLLWYSSPCTQVAFDVVKIFWRNVASYSNEFTDPNSGLGWDDQLILKLGIAWRYYPWLTLRIGYNHGNTVLPGSQGFLNAIDMEGIENHFTLGASLYCGVLGELSIVYIHGFRHTVAGKSLTVQSTNLVTRQNSVGLQYGRHF